MEILNVSSELSNENEVSLKETTEIMANFKKFTIRKTKYRFKNMFLMTDFSEPSDSKITTLNTSIKVLRRGLVL